MNTLQNTTSDSLSIVPQPRTQTIKLALILSLSSFWPLSAGAFASLYIFRSAVSVQQANRLWDIAIGLLIAGPLPALLVLLTTNKGSWRFAADDLQYHPLRGKIRKLPWSDITNVRYSYTFNKPRRWRNVVTQGKGTTIYIPLHAFSESDRRFADHALKQHLPRITLPNRPSNQTVHPSILKIILGPGSLVSVFITVALCMALNYLGKPLPWYIAILIGCWMWLMLCGFGSSNYLHPQDSPNQG